MSGEDSRMRNFIICTANIVRVIKSRRLKWAGHVVKIEEGKSDFKILTGKPSVDGKTILE